MSYRRSPRCTNCYHVGHTRRSCPSIKEMAAIAAAKPYEERSYSEKRAVETVQAYKEQVKERACAYCAENGHNVAGCKARKQDIITTAARLVSWRKDFLIKCKQVGLGVGAVLSTQAFSYVTSSRVKHYYIATKFNQNTLAYWTQDIRRCVENTISVRSVNAFDLKDDKGQRVYEQTLALPDQFVYAMFPTVSDSDEVLRSRYYRSEIESPIFENTSLGFSSEEFVSSKACSEVVQRAFDEVEGRGKNKKKRSQYALRLAGILKYPD